MRLIAATALSLFALTFPALAETNVGVTAAVNQDAKGTVGSTVKTISLGDSVVFNQRIQTGGSGLVQVLLADGTTFMVGPNSNLVIDSFVYDPNAGTAQVTASFTKGVLRFIGGQTSKTPNGVTLNTPVGTMGIRGAMVDVVLDPPAGTPPHIDMLFGNEVTLEQGQQLLGRLYAAGYSLALGANGSFDVLKTPPGWGSQIQAALAGAPGTKGGAPKGPTDSDVKNSEVADNNSGKGPDLESPPLSEQELDALLYAAAHYDELRDFITNNQTPQGFVGGVVAAVGEGYWAAPIRNAFDPETGELMLADVAFDADGNPVRIKAPLQPFIPLCVELGPCGVLTYEGDGVDGSVTAEGLETPVPPVTTDGNVLVEENFAGLQCDCEEFVRWGFWGFEALNANYESETADLYVQGAWVTGDLATAADLDVLATEWGTTSASYVGDMVGVVHATEGDALDYVETGTFGMDWNFGDREGEFYGNFRGASFGGDLSASEGGAGFAGELDGQDYDEYSPVFGGVNGGFVNDGDNLGAGVIGNFNLIGQDWHAGGVFMGSQATD